MSQISVSGQASLRGRLRVPGDKSISHRAVLLGALAHGTSVVRGRSEGDDVARTVAAVEAMGADVKGERISGGELSEPRDVVDVGNSGTTIRLLAGMAAAQPFLTVLTGDDSIATRPMARIVDPLREMGATIEARADGTLAPLAIRGGALHGIDYRMPVASAQVKSAILLAGLGAEGETTVRQGVATRAHTEEMLAACGADISTDGLDVTVRPSKLEPFELEVPGDPSHAAFWIVAACLCPDSEVTVEGVYVGPARLGFVGVLRRMGADIEVDVDSGDITARTSELTGTNVGGAEIPTLADEIPVLAVAAACADGTSVFSDAAELAVKESNRIATVCSELGAMGGRVEPQDDGLVVHGGGLRAGHVRSHGDHRIAMAMAVAALAAEGSTAIDGWNATATSYPAFLDDLGHLER